MTPPRATSSSATTSLHPHPEPCRRAAERGAAAPNFPKNNDMPPGSKELTDGPFLPQCGKNGPSALSSFRLSPAGGQPWPAFCATAVRSRAPKAPPQAPKAGGRKGSPQPGADRLGPKWRTGMAKAGHFVRFCRPRRVGNRPWNRNNRPWNRDNRPWNRNNKPCIGSKAPWSCQKPCICNEAEAGAAARPATTLKNVQRHPCLRPSAQGTKAEKNAFPCPANCVFVSLLCEDRMRFGQGMGKQVFPGLPSHLSLSLAAPKIEAARQCQGKRAFPWRCSRRAGRGRAALPHTGQQPCAHCCSTHPNRRAAPP